MTLRSTLKRVVSTGDTPGVDRTEWYAERWAEAAEAAGWDLPWRHGGFLELRCGERRLFVCRSDAGLDSNASFRIAGNKGLAAELLDRAGVVRPRSKALAATQWREIVAAVDRLGPDAVVKPMAGGAGTGVTVGPVGRAMLTRAIGEAALNGRSIAVEERLTGDVLRVLVLDGRVLDAVRRSPAAVVGDGRSDVAALVEVENRRRRELGPLATGFVATGADHLAALVREGLGPSSVPEARRRVTVAGRSNSGSELESCRVPLVDEAGELATLAALAIGVRLAGVDLVVDADGQPKGVLEVNTAPGLHWHRLVSGEPFDPFGPILHAAGSGAD